MNGVKDLWLKAPEPAPARLRRSEAGSGGTLKFQLVVLTGQFPALAVFLADNFFGVFHVGDFAFDVVPCEFLS
jgi:hypothetical protein